MKVLPAAAPERKLDQSKVLESLEAMGRILKEAGVTEDEALAAVALAISRVYGPEKADAAEGLCAQGAQDAKRPEPEQKDPERQAKTRHLCRWCFSLCSDRWGSNYCCGSCEVAYWWDKGDELSSRIAAHMYNVDWRHAMKSVFGAKWKCRFCGVKPVKHRGDVCSREDECVA